MRGLLAITTALLALTGCAAGSAIKGPFRLVPLASDGRTLAAGTSVRHVQPGLLVELRAIDSQQRGEWIREHVPGAGDPLAKLPGGDRFLTFVMRLGATGDLPVHLETQSLRLWPDKGRLSTAPLDYTRAFELLRPDRESGAAAAQVRAFMRGLLDGPIDVLPGKEREGLLIFPGPSPEATRLLFELPFVQVGSTTYRVRIPFDKTPIEAPSNERRQPSR